MSNQNLPAGAFFTSINGRRCTAVPRSDIPVAAATATAATAPAVNTANNEGADGQVAGVETEQPAAIPTVPSDVADGNALAGAPPVVATPAVSQNDNLAEGANANANAGANNAAANPNLVTTIGLDAAAEADTAPSDGPTVAVVDTGNNNQGGGAPTAVVAGSVIGGLAVVSLIAFLLWFWRKRVLRKRRSTLLTPLSVPVFGRKDDEKGNFVVDRGSIGPTPKAEKFAAAVGSGFKRIFTKSRDEGTPAVNMNRGNSQFMDPVGQHSRNNSGLTSGRGSNKGEVTGKDRFMDWWSRLTADVSFNWKLRNDRNNDPDPFSAARDMKQKQAMGSQPDFLTLLGMDDKEVQREAERRQMAQHAAKGSSSSTDHFLKGLNLNFDSGKNPFSDANALPHDSAKVAPLTVSGPNNPFSDDNAIRSKPPNTYVADVRRSRGQSVGGGPGAIRSSNAPYSPRVESMYRESVNSVESFGARRNKFRSDPFDLETPELLARQNVTSSNFSTAGSSVAPRLSSADGVNRPSRAHHRGESFSSKYSSGISMGDWSDPGPDVGPGGRRWDSPTEGWRDDEEAQQGSSSRRSGGSQSSVGKAL